MRIFSENKVKGFGILDYAGKRRYGSVFGSVGEKLYMYISNIFTCIFENSIYEYFRTYYAANMFLHLFSLLLARTFNRFYRYPIL